MAPVLAQKAQKRIEKFMREALTCGRRSLGRTYPNPSVGAVVFRGDRILGRGSTRPPGGSHAEVVALEAVRSRHGDRALAGASLAVTLEPCCFTGRTGPCTEAIIEAGISRVYVGTRDPHPRVKGRGMRRLETAGVEVVQGILEPDCKEHHRGFFMVCERGRPFVTLKLASTLDGRIATVSGESRWITGPEARAMVHRLRAKVDAVMVGSGTALADNPQLTARRGDRVVARPSRVLVDSRLRVPPEARLFDPSRESATLVLTRARARGRRAITAAGARLIDLPGPAGQMDLVEGMQRLAQAGLTTVLVEGGGQLAAMLLRAELVDEIHWLLAPRLIGEDGRPALGVLGTQRLAQALTLSLDGAKPLGRDLYIQARLDHGREGDTK